MSYFEFSKDSIESVSKCVCGFFFLTSLLLVSRRNCGEQAGFPHTSLRNQLLTVCFISLCNVSLFPSLFADLHSCELRLCPCPPCCCHAYSGCYVTTVSNLPCHSHKVDPIPHSYCGSNSSHRGHSFCLYVCSFFSLLFSRNLYPVCRNLEIIPTSLNF